MMGWIQKWFNVLPLESAVRLLQSSRLPPRAAAITFDDGYADNAAQALPVLHHYGFSATFFVATGFMDGGRMWNDSIIEAVRRTRQEALDLRACGLSMHQELVPLRSLQQRRDAIEKLLIRIKYLAPLQRNQAISQVVAAAGVDLPNDLMLRTDQLLALRDSGMQIGAHTVNHPILASTTDADALWEIAQSKRTLEERLDQEVTLFAYPNGKPGPDYAVRHVEMVREAGFVAAVNTAAGVAGRDTDAFQLPRFTPWERNGLRFGLSMLRNLRHKAYS
jgi:peptidoglycan/xylan/chitin deacetylase (PgdA/CDA1 family)